MTRRVVVAVLAGATVTAGTAAAQTVRLLKFTPDVVVPGRTAPALMEVETAAAPDTYAIAVVGTSGVLKRSATVTLTVH